MSDSNSDSNQDIPLLEEVNTVEFPEAGADSLLGDSAAHMASKLIALESFLKLLPQDLKFQDFIRETLVIMMRVVKSEASSVLEVNHSNQTLFFRAAAGQASDQVVQFTIPMGQGIAGHVTESKQTLVVSNVQENQQHLKMISNAIGFETRNLIALPIVVRGQIFGVLELLNRIGEDDFTLEDVELLEQTCELLSKIIEIRLMLSWTEQSARVEPKKDEIA